MSARMMAMMEALSTIEQDAGWLHDHVPDYSPDGVATLRDIARTIAQTAYRARVSLLPLPSWSTDNDGYVVAPLENRGTLDAG